MAKFKFFVAVVVLLLLGHHRASACTGITLRAADGSCVPARTVEWKGGNLNSCYVVVPRGHRRRSLLPGGAEGGMMMEARYGYVGIATERPEFVTEGLNEAGLSVGFFYFPNYGSYADYDPQQAASTVGDLQLAAWLLGSCKSLDEVRAAVGQVRVAGIYPQAGTVHWRFTEPGGAQMILEIVGGVPHFYDSKLGVLTNAPGYQWQLANLNNYVNLRPGSASPYSLGALRLEPIGSGSGLLGLPGDDTPPSRFVRAAFYQTSAPQQATGRDAAMQCLQILNNFDIPIGSEYNPGETPADIPSATQWAAASDVSHRVVYYRTMYNSAVRCFKLDEIDFTKVSYRSAPLDADRVRPVYQIEIK